MRTATDACDVGLVGLGVMGRNLALNIADHGYRIAVYNRTVSATHEFIQEDPHENVVPHEDLKALVSALNRPRIIVVLVAAGKPVDLVCQSLLDAGVQADDIVVDGGNSLWTDTIRREREYRGRLTFFGSGVSGGELGARFGPSLMPGGDMNAWQRLRPIWEAIAAKVDPETGKEVPVSQQAGHHAPLEPCTAYIGPNGAGHYVKMVHNGIEYADMQLICEAYHLLRECANLTPPEIGDVFGAWNTGDLDSFLIEITADILRQADPVTGRPFVDVVLDRAGQKGTGKWTAVNALDMGTPATTIGEAVFARAMSAIKDERVHAAGILAGKRGACEVQGPAFVEQVRDALYCSKICAYAQGFQLMAAAQREYDWQLNFGEIARIWRGGCIIRAAFLQKITEAYQRTPNLANLVLDPYFSGQIANLQDAWRRVVAQAAMVGVPVPAFASALAYFDSYRSDRLPANLLQAQRDYFGAHTYERVDQPRGMHFHIDWPDPQRPQVQVS